jgi:DNA-binding NtrC family response regulator
LIVEDDEGVRDILASELRGRGHEVVAVGTKEQARHALDDATFQVLVVDVGLPDGRGIDLAADAAAQNCKPVIISGNMGTIHMLRDRHLPFLEKPFTVDQLLDTLHLDPGMHRSVSE